MKPYAVAALISLAVSLGTTVLLYRVICVHLWREYYRFNEHTPSVRMIDTGDKLNALMFAIGLGALWPISLPMYIVWRRVQMRRRHVRAYDYADRHLRDIWRI